MAWPRGHHSQGWATRLYLLTAWARKPSGRKSSDQEIFSRHQKSENKISTPFSTDILILLMNIAKFYSNLFLPVRQAMHTHLAICPSYQALRDVVSLVIWHNLIVGWFQRPSSHPAVFWTKRESIEDQGLYANVQSFPQTVKVIQLENTMLNCWICWQPA